MSSKKTNRDRNNGDDEYGAAPSRSEFLKKTMSDRNFALNRGTIVSASPFRAVIRRND